MGDQWLNDCLVTNIERGMFLLRLKMRNSFNIYEK